MALVTYSAAFGFILSLDIFHMTHVIVNCATKGCQKDGHLSTITSIVKYGILLVIGTGIAGTTSHFHEDATRSMFDSFGYVFVVLLLLLKLLGDLQYVYVASGLARNPFHIKTATSVDVLRKFQHKIGYVGHIYNILLSYGTCFIISNSCHMVTVHYMIPLIFHVSYLSVCPLIIIAFLGTFLNASKDLSPFVKALGIIRSLRWVRYRRF